MELKENFEEASVLYNIFRERFYDFLSEYNSWEEYKDKYLVTEKAKYNRDEFTEKFIRRLYFKITNDFIIKHAFLKPYAKPSKNHTIIESSGEAIKVKVEFYNDLNPEDLWYPNYTECINLHSAIHSLTMFLSFRDSSRNDQFALYMRPLLTHPGDKEYTLYYLTQYNFPTVILTRQENISWLLQTNLLPKLTKGMGGGRWCTRVFKTEPAYLFYKEYFYPWQYKFTKKELLKYCKQNNIDCKTSMRKSEIIKEIEKRLKVKTLFGKTIEPPNKTRYTKNYRKYQFYKYNRANKEWKQIDYSDNKFHKYKKITEKMGAVDRFVDWEKTDSIIEVYNLLQLIGINKYHSPQRARSNPNVKIWRKSTSDFKIFEYYPIYEYDIIDMRKVVSLLGKGLRDNPFEKEHSLAYEKQYDTKKEQRYGCIICPYRPLEYYRNLKEKYPYQYFYCMTIRLISSAKNIIEDGREYWYEGKDVECPII